MRTLRELREAQGLSRFQLSVKAGMPEGTIYKYETGLQIPGSLQLRSLARALGVKMDDIRLERKNS